MRILAAERRRGSASPLFCSPAPRALWFADPALLAPSADGCSASTDAGWQSAPVERTMDDAISAAGKLLRRPRKATGPGRGSRRRGAGGEGRGSCP